MTFPLKIVTPDGLIFDGEADKLIIRTTTGDLAILARHIDCVYPLGMGQAMVEINGQRRTAACIGGMLSVIDGECALAATTWEWAEQIDRERTEQSLRRAEAVLKDPNSTAPEIRIAEARRKRALIRRCAAELPKD